MPPGIHSNLRNIAGSLHFFRVQLKGVGTAALLLLFNAAILKAQVTPPPPPPPPAAAVVPRAVPGAFTLEGSVTGTLDQPLPYTTITIEQLGQERFTDQNGHFTYFAVPPGNYKIRLRQIGYLPIDTTLSLNVNARTPVFSMRKIPSTLAAVEITAPPRKCIVPEENGFVDDPELAVVLSEARKNAERERMLRRTYPFEYKLAQQHVTFDMKDSTQRVVYDTATFRSDDSWQYRKGRVVSDDKNKLFGDVRVVDLQGRTDSLENKVRARREGTMSRRGSDCSPLRRF